jgi:signal transduction histidine kinase/HAMP domain-containing protein
MTGRHTVRGPDGALKKRVGKARKINVKSIFASIRAKLLMAFLAVAMLTGAFGIYAVGTIRHTGDLVKATYDKPLMAINFARSAQFAFSQMERATLRFRTSDNAEVRRAERANIARWHRTLKEDLAVARTRSLSERARNTVDELAAMAGRWRDGYAPLLDGTPGIDVTVMHALSDRILSDFELLIDYTAGDGFRFRQNARDEVSRMGIANTIAVCSVLALSLIIALLLARRIIRPLKSAANVAARISAGELNVAIPDAGADETGELLRAMAVMQGNLRKIMQNEVALRKAAEARLIAIERSNEGLILVDPDDRIVLANRQLARLLPETDGLLGAGHSFTRGLRHAGLFDAIFPVVSNAAVKNLATVLELSDAESHVSELSLADGRWVRISMSRAGTGEIVGICSDITELKDREENYRRAKDEAESASKAKSAFLANMSHELRTPLNAVIGFSQLLVSEPFGPMGDARYKQYIFDIQGSGQHLLDLINDILDMSKIEAGEMTMTEREFGLADLALSCIRLMSERAKKGLVTVESRIMDDLPMIYADERMIRQVLLNLLSNAVKFTPENGRVSLDARITGDNELRIEIADNGIGIAEKDIETVMQPFGQAESAHDRRYEGTGLGLPLVKAIVALHGGEFRLDSRLDEGTTVTVTLPSGRIVQQRQFA